MMMMMMMMMLVLLWLIAAMVCKHVWGPCYSAQRAACHNFNCALSFAQFKFKAFKACVAPPLPQRCVRPTSTQQFVRFDFEVNFNRIKMPLNHCGCYKKLSQMIAPKLS
jgi:hypothetical protein